MSLSSKSMRQWLARDGVMGLSSKSLRQWSDFNMSMYQE